MTTDPSANDDHRLPHGVRAEDLRPSAVASLADVRRRFPDAGLLALGQTVWWDEPVKAVLRVMLDALGLGGRMVLGVHDTDYFARVRARLPGQGRYALMPHNDGATRDLWSAAGEISRLFGSEHFPTRHDLGRHGVPVRRLAARANGAAGSYLDAATEAWGWRGLVYTGSRNLIVHSMQLKEVLAGIDEMLRFGFEGTIETIADGCCRNKARAVAETLRGWVHAYAETHPDATLSNLYEDLYPRLMGMLMGREPADVETASTAHLLVLDTHTAALPRFEFLDLFMRQRTRPVAVRAYNEAVAGSEMYTLDRFGLGAIPFDVVTTRHGRGTLRVTLRAVHIETPQPMRIPLYRPIEGTAELAGLLARELGDHVTVVGKAVALIPMLAREFLFVFSEDGSGYVSRTRKMLDTLATAGIEFDVHPIVRLHYQTWDSATDVQARVRLPDHLRAAFGTETVTGSTLAGRWAAVVEEQRRALEQVRGLAQPAELMRYLASRGDERWAERAQRYDAALAVLKRLRVEGEALQGRTNDGWAEVRQLREQIRSLERTMGDHFRSTQQWTPEEEARRAGYAAQLSAVHARRRSVLALIREVKAKRWAIERGPEATAARAERAQLEDEAGDARLHLVRAAILAIGGLTRTDHRPSAWWLPMVDPDGEWFRRLVRTTEVYLEPLRSP